MGAIQEVVTRHRQDLRDNEINAVRKMTSAYQQIEDRLMFEAKKLLNDLGPDTTISKFLSLRRTRDLLEHVETLFDSHATDVVRREVLQLTEEAINLAQAHADEVIRAALGPNKGAVLPIAQIPEGAIANIFSATSEQGPLSSLLESFGKEAASKARRDLITGVALGEHPSKIARRLKHSLQTNNQRAMLIARTETLRAYRESHRATYNANSQIVTRWIWSASLSSRTCACCWALHGQEFDLDTPMANHPNCRCSMAPKTKTWAELGFKNVPESRPEFQSGSSLFALEPDSVKRGVLGPAAFDSYSKGDVKLTDFIHVEESEEWGTTYRRGSLANALNN